MPIYKAKGENAAVKIVVLDGYTENPGDLSWEKLEALGELTVYEGTEGQNKTQYSGPYIKFKIYFS